MAFSLFRRLIKLITVMLETQPNLKYDKARKFILQKMIFYVIAKH